MDAYRIVSWNWLSGDRTELKFRRAMIAMSVNPVSMAWLTREGGLTRPEAKSLLLALRQSGALEIIPGGAARARQADPEPAPTCPGNPMSQVAAAPASPTFLRCRDALRRLLGRPDRPGANVRTIDVEFDFTEEIAAPGARSMIEPARARRAAAQRGRPYLKA